MNKKKRHDLILLRIAEIEMFFILSTHSQRIRLEDEK